MASFAGSILDNGTKATPGVPYYSGGGGGGGGGSGTNVSSVTSATSSLTVSSITGANSLPVIVTNGLSMAGGAQLQFIAGGGLPDIAFAANNGALTGVSSINGASYPPSGAVNISTPLTSKYIAPDVGPQSISPSFSTILNGWYNGSLGISDWALTGQPNVGDHVAVLADTTVLGTLDLVQASTLKGKGQPYGMVMSGPFKAAASGSQFLAYTNVGCAVSTFLTFDFAGWVSPLQ